MVMSAAVAKHAEANRNDKMPHAFCPQSRRRIVDRITVSSIDGVTAILELGPFWCGKSVLNDSGLAQKVDLCHNVDES